MNIRVISKPFHHIIIENVFDENEYNMIWNELIFLQPKMKTPDQTGAAQNHFGNRIKRGVGIFLEDFFSKPPNSEIFICTRKFFNSNLIDVTKKLDAYFKLYSRIIKDSILIQSYRNGDYYSSHPDNCIFTIINLFHKTPKKYTGGEIYFAEYDYEVLLENNSCLIFPSPLLHEVKEVKLDSNDPQDFRYTVSMFLEDRIPEIAV